MKPTSQKAVTGLTLSFTLLACATFFFQTTTARADQDVVDLPVPSVAVPLVNENPAAHKKIRRIIPQAAFIVSGYSGFSADSFSYRNGVGAGATADLGDGDLVFETGVLYRQMGADFKVASGGMSISGSQLAGYLSIPVDGKWYFNGQGGSSGFLKFGLLPSVLLSHTVRVNTPFASTPGLNLNTFDVGYVVGLGTKIDVNRVHSLLVDASYIHGLVNVTPDSNSGGLFNSAFVFSAGYSFDVD